MSPVFTVLVLSLPRVQLTQAEDMTTMWDGIILMLGGVETLQDVWIGVTAIIGPQMVFVFPPAIRMWVMTERMENILDMQTRKEDMITLRMMIEVFRGTLTPVMKREQGATEIVMIHMSIMVILEREVQ